MNILPKEICRIRDEYWILTDKAFPPRRIRAAQDFRARNLTIMGAAAALGGTRQGLSDFLAEKVSLTVEIAFQTEKAFEFKAEALMEMQTRHDLAILRQRDRVVQMQLVNKPVSKPKRAVGRSAA